MNNCQFVGRLTADPELRRTQEGTAVCSYSLAVKRPMAKDVTDFLDFVTWRQGAEYLTQYGHKGDIVAASGALQARDWTDKNGNKRRAFEVVTTSVELLSSKRNSQDTTNRNGAKRRIRAAQRPTADEPGQRIQSAGVRRISGDHRRRPRLAVLGRKINRKERKRDD